MALNKLSLFMDTRARIYHQSESRANDNPYLFLFGFFLSLNQSRFAFTVYLALTIMIGLHL